MKKLSLIISFIVFGLSLNSIAQTTAPTDFYVSKWEITIFGTPQGDAKMIANIYRKDGNLTGEITNPAEPSSEAAPLTSIEEVDGKITIYFSAGGYDLSIPFEKVDDNNLKGQLMGMFDCKAIRIKE